MAKQRTYPAPLTECPPLETWWPAYVAWRDQNLSPPLYWSDARVAVVNEWSARVGLKDNPLPHEQPEGEAK